MGEKLNVIAKVPTRTQRLLLRFLKSELDADINFDMTNIDKSISEYLMVCVAIIKKYLPMITLDQYELFLRSCQVLTEAI